MGLGLSVSNESTSKCKFTQVAKSSAPKFGLTTPCCVHALGGVSAKLMIGAVNRSLICLFYEALVSMACLPHCLLDVPMQRDQGTHHSIAKLNQRHRQYICYPIRASCVAIDL